MAKRRHGQEAELPFVALMDTMTNVVGVLTIVLVMVGISIAHAVKKILTANPPATAAQVATAQTSVNQLKAELAAAAQVAALPTLPDSGDIAARLVQLEAQVQEKNLKLFDLPVLNQELATKSAELSLQQTELSALITERDRLRVLLAAPPQPMPPHAKIIRIPSSRDIPKDANVYHCFVRKDQVYLVDPISAKEMLMHEFDHEKNSLIKHRIKVPKAKDRIIYDQQKVLNLFAAKPLAIRGQKITVPPNTYGNQLVFNIELPPSGDASLADMENPKGRFQALAYILRSYPKIVLWFQVNPDGFATYLKARDIADRNHIPCGWDINGNNSLTTLLDFEVNPLAPPPPAPPPPPGPPPVPGPPPPKPQLD